MRVQQIFPENLHTVPAECLYFFRCEQSSGDLTDLRGVQAVKNAGFLDATLWANAGYATIGGAAGNYCTLPAVNHDLDHINNTIIVTARFKRTTPGTPGAAQYLAQSYTPGSAFGGIILGCQTGGLAQLLVNTTDNTTSTINANNYVVSTDGAEHSCVFVVPRNAVSATVAVDGIQRSSTSAAAIAGKSIAGGNVMKIGGSTDSFQLAAFATYQVPVDVSIVSTILNPWLNKIYRWAHQNPAIPIPAEVLYPGL